MEACRDLCLTAPYRCHSFDYADTGDRVCRYLLETFFKSGKTNPPQALPSHIHNLDTDTRPLPCHRGRERHL